MAVNEDKLQLKPELEKAEQTPELSGAERETTDKKLAELTKILTSIGVEDVKDRLTLCQGAFRLVGTQSQHAIDSEILFDLEKITPLVDAGYVTVDAETDGKDYSIVILSSDSMPDFEIPDSDDPDAIEFGSGPKENQLKEDEEDNEQECMIYGTIPGAAKITDRYKVADSVLKVLNIQPDDVIGDVDADDRLGDDIKFTVPVKREIAHFNWVANGEGQTAAFVTIPLRKFMRIAGIQSDGWVSPTQG